MGNPAPSSVPIAAPQTEVCCSEYLIDFVNYNSDDIFLLVPMHLLNNILIATKMSISFQVLTPLI